MEMELNHLTEEERDRILSVLRRDEELRSRDLERIRQLKAEVKRIRLKGVIKAGHDPDNTCARCREKFGWLFNKGAPCPQCQHRVCEACRAADTDLSSDGQWLCILCFKQMKLDAMSGQWFLMKFRKSKRSRKTNKVITGQDLVKSSIWRRPPTTDEEEACEGGSGSEPSRPESTTDDVRKCLSNNNSSPKSSRSVGSASVEESSDTQSTASTSPGRKRRVPDVHEVGFPKESDKQKLMDLIRSKAPVIGTPKDGIAKPTVEVRKVSLSRYRSDSESSSSESGPSSPQLSARTDSEFRYSDSIRSSIRSSGAFSAVSSEGRITIVTESCVSDMDTTSLSSQMSGNDSRSAMSGAGSPNMRDMYDKDTGHFQSTDSVIENKVHRVPPQQSKLTGLCRDITDGSVSISDSEISVRKVISSKHADSMSSDSEAEETSTEQVSKVKFRRIPVNQPHGRSRSPSPEPSSKLRPADGTANSPIPSEENGRAALGASQSGVAAQGESGTKDGQAGGETNTTPHSPSSSPSTLVALSHKQHNHATTTQEKVVDGEVSSQDKPQTTTIRSKVGALLAKYGRLDGSDEEEAVSVTNGGGSAESLTSSSYEVIDDVENAQTLDDSSFEDLEWDSDLLIGHQTMGIDGEGDWDELRAAVAANMAAQMSHQSDDFSDSDEEENVRYVLVNSGTSEVNYRTQDDCSDTLSVITELTEPDEDFYQLEKEVFARAPSITKDHTRMHPTDTIDYDKDHCYFTLPGNGAVSRTESMRSAAESERSHSSITPSSDVDTDLSLSQFSDISATESTQDSTILELKNHYASGKHYSLDDMVWSAQAVKGTASIEFDDMYRLNLSYLEESDLQGLTLPSIESLKPSMKDPFLHKNFGFSPRELQLTDHRMKNDSPKGINSPTTVFEVRKQRCESLSPGEGVRVQRSHSDRWPISKSRSEVALKAVKEHVESPMSPDLQQKRAQLKRVRTKRLSDLFEYGRKASRDEKTVDNSHLASISSLTKMFDKPPPWLTPTVNKDRIAEVAKDENEQLVTEDDIDALGLKISDLPSAMPTYEDTERLRKSVVKCKDNSPESMDNVPEHTKATDPADVQKVQKVQLTNIIKKERKEKMGRSKTVKPSKTKKDVERKFSNKLLATKVDQNNKDNESVHLQAMNKERDVAEGSQTVDMDEMTSMTTEHKLEITSEISSITHDETSILSKLIPVPTVPMKAEKVGTPISVPLRERICEEQDREVLENIELYDNQLGTLISHEEVQSPSYMALKKYERLQESSTGKASPQRHTSLNRSWHSQPSAIEEEVQQQLDDWKKKRGRHRLKSHSSEATMDMGSLYSQFKHGMHSDAFRTSTPPVAKPDKEDANPEPITSKMIDTVILSDRSPVLAASQKTVNADQLLVVEKSESEEEIPESDRSLENKDTSYGSYELEAAFLLPRAPTPVNTLNEDDDDLTPQPLRPLTPTPLAITDVIIDDLKPADSTESTLTPEPLTPESDSILTPNLPSTYTHSPISMLSDGSALSESPDEEKEHGELDGVSDLSEEPEELRYSTCTGSIDKHANGHADVISVTSSMTESDAGSASPRHRASQAYREHNTSGTSVPSINVTHHDKASRVDDSVSISGVGGVSGSDTPGTTSSTTASPQHHAGTETAPGSGTEEEGEDIDELVASHTSPSHSVHSQKGGSMLSPFSGSRESIVSFYSDAGEGNYGNIPITGDIQLSLDYNYKTGSLEVRIKQCRDIAPVDTKKKRSDPYVKVYLLPDKTKSGKRKTRVKKHTLNPVFEEVLKYAITKSELETRTLWLTVWHSDMFGRNDFLGEVTIPLDYYTFGEAGTQWYKLQERNASPLSLLTYKGDLILSLKYVTGDNAPSIGGKARGGGGTGHRRPGCGELHVLLKEARNLTAVRANGFSDPFCKGYLLPDKGRGTKQKTPVAKRDCNPQWNHTFVFEDITLDDLRDRSLELTIWDHDRFTSNDFLGGLRLNIGAGKVGGKEVDWMDSRGEEISMWQSMLDRPNCWIDGSLMLRTTMERRK